MISVPELRISKIHGNKGFFGVGCDISGLDVTLDVTLKKEGNIMRFISVLGGAVVFLCNLYISFFHTLDLFRSGGLTGGMEYVAAIGAEIAFFTFAVTIVYARLRHIRPGWPSILGGLLGVSLVGWSNIAAGWSYGLVGILIGIYFPAMLLVVEANLTRTAAMRRNQPASQAAESTNQLADQRSKITDQPATSTSQSTTVNQVADQKSASQPSGRKVVDQTTSHVSRNSQQSATVNRSISQQNPPVAEVVEKAVEADRPAVSQVAETVSQSTDKSASGQPTINQPPVTNRTKVVNMADRRKRSAEADPKVVEKAEKYYREKGELPSERKLADLAETTRYQAGKAIDYLKKKYNIDNQSTNRSASGR